MVEKRSESNDLVGAAGVLELARVEARAAAEEVVDFTGFHVVWETGDEECVDVASLVLLVQEIRVEWLLIHSEGCAGEGELVGAVVCGGDGGRRRRN